MSRGLSEDNANMLISSSKLVLDIMYKAMEKSIYKIIHNNKSEDLKAGKNNLQELVKKRGNLKEVDVDKKDIKELNNLMKKSKLPCAFYTVGGDNKCRMVFFEAHTELTTNVFKEMINNKLKETKKEKTEKENNKEKVNGNTDISKADSMPDKIAQKER